MSNVSTLTTQSQSVSHVNDNVYTASVHTVSVSAETFAMTCETDLVYTV